MSRTENSESQLVRYAFLGGAACGPAAACDLSPPCTQRVRTGGTLHWWPERTRSESAGGVLSTESSLGLSFVAQPTRGEKRFKAEAEGPTGLGEWGTTHSFNFTTHPPVSIKNKPRTGGGWWWATCTQCVTNTLRTQPLPRLQSGRGHGEAG